MGRLVAVDPSLDKEALFFGTEKNASSSPAKSSNKIENSKSPSLRRLQSPRKIPQKVGKTEEGVDADKGRKCTEDDLYGEQVLEPVLPRFDWIQKMDSINVIFYTKAFSNPQVSIV